MPAGIGYSFAPQSNDVRLSGGSKSRPHIGPQEAIRLINLHIPKSALGPSAIAPRELLQSPGAAGVPNLNSILAALAQSFAPPHQPGVPFLPESVIDTPLGRGGAPPVPTFQPSPPIPRLGPPRSEFRVFSPPPPRGEPRLPTFQPSPPPPALPTVTAPQPQPSFSQPPQTPPPTPRVRIPPPNVTFGAPSRYVPPTDINGAYLSEYYTPAEPLPDYTPPRREIVTAPPPVASDGGLFDDGVRGPVFRRRPFKLEDFDFELF